MDQATGTQPSSNEQAGTPPPTSEQPQGTDQQQQAEGGASGGGSQERSAGGNRNGWLQTWLLGGGRQSTSEATEDGASGAALPEGQQRGAAARAPATSKADDQGEATKPKAVDRSILRGDPNEQLALTRGDVLRLAQSWKDQEIDSENRRNADLAAMRASAAQLDRLRELADPRTGDPDKLMEEVTAFLANRDNQAAHFEQHERTLSVVRDVGSRYDSELLQPLLAMLPEATRTTIEREAPSELVGLPHRAYLFQKGLEALQSHWTREAEAQARRSLRANEAFRKEILHGMRGDLPEPELVPATAPSARELDINTWFRQALR